MTLKDFQILSLLDSGSTTYESDVIDYFKLDRSKPNHVLRKEVKRLISNDPVNDIKDKYFINGKWYGLDKELIDGTTDQFSTLDKLLAEDNNIQNFHKLLAIYVRPIKKSWLGKETIEPFNLKNQNEIAEELLNIESNLALGMLVFFYQIGIRYMNYITIYYLNQAKKPWMMD